MDTKDDDHRGSRKRPQKGTPGYRIWAHVDPMARVRIGRKAFTLEACLIGFVLIAVWVNAGIIIWRDLLG